MSTRNWLMRLEDILEALERISEYCSSLDFEHWANDNKTIDAVIRNLEIIGEAAGSIPESIKDQSPGIPWQQMKGLRNILIHEYFGIDTEIIWKTVQNDLPELQKAISNLLEKHAAR